MAFKLTTTLAMLYLVCSASCQSLAPRRSERDLGVGGLLDAVGTGVVKPVGGLLNQVVDLLVSLLQGNPKMLPALNQNPTLIALVLSNPILLNLLLANPQLLPALLDNPCLLPTILAGLGLIPGQGGLPKPAGLLPPGLLPPGCGGALPQGLCLPQMALAALPSGCPCQGCFLG